MENKETVLEEKRARLQKLVDSRSDSTCETDTRHLSPADVRREQEIDDLEAEIEQLEQSR